MSEDAITAPRTLASESFGQRRIGWRPRFAPRVVRKCFCRHSHFAGEMMRQKHLKDTAPIRNAWRLYRALLYFYPADFRSRFGHQMALLFRDQFRDLQAQWNPAQCLRFAAHAVIDLLKSSLWERSTSMSAIAIISLTSAIAGGLFAAYVDFHNNEVRAPMLVILVTTFLLGAAYPRLAWLYALLVAICLTAAHLIAPTFGIQPLYPSSSSPFSLLFAPFQPR